MKKNAWVKYWERVDKNFIWGGFGESNPYIIKFIYFITFIGLLFLLELVGEQYNINIGIIVGVDIGIIDILDGMNGFLISSLGGFGGLLWVICVLFVFGGTLYSLYFLYTLIKSFFK